MTKLKLDANFQALFVFAAAMVLPGCGRENPETRQKPLVVFAAASLTDVLSEVGESFEQEFGSEVTFNFAGSNVLAQQILAAPNADLFLSASERWMDAVEQGGRIAADSRETVFSNSLVVVAHPSSEIAITKPENLCDLDFKFLALGNPDAVPAGRYAREWLQSIENDTGTLWDCVEARISPAPDVRAALGQVEANPDVIGIIYRTDYLTATYRVKLLYELPVEDGPPVRYVVAQLKNADNADAAQEFLDFLNSETAHSIFVKHGFLIPISVPVIAESLE